MDWLRTTFFLGRNITLIPNNSERRVAKNYRFEKQCIDFCSNDHWQYFLVATHKYAETGKCEFSTALKSVKTVK